MYLERVKAKGRYYVYLKMYDQNVTYSKDKRVIVHSFGRQEKALNDMKKWEKNFSEMPESLKKIGATEKELHSWINYLNEKTRNDRLVKI